MPKQHESSNREQRGSHGPTAVNVQTKKSESGTSSQSSTPAPACRHKRRIVDWTLSYIGYGVYVGNLRAACAKILSDNGITHVLSLLKPGEEPEEKLDAFFCKKLDIRDEEGFAIKQFTGIIDSAMRFIDEVTSGKNKILVYCKQGRSRSVMTVIAYLKHRKRFTWFQAFCHVAEKRPYIGLHDEFSDYLREKKKKEDSEVDGPDNFDFKLDGFLWPKMETVAQKNAQHLVRLKEEEKKRRKAGTSLDKHIQDTHKDEVVKLTVQIPKRADSPIPNLNVVDSLSRLYG